MGKVIICFIVIMAFFTGIACAETVIICNPGVQETTIAPKALQKIFLGKTTKWGDNSKINIVVLKDTDQHKLFLESYIHRTYSQWKSHWKKMVFTGKGVKPKQFDDAGTYLGYISSTPGAVGYIDAGLANDTVKILSVNSELLTSDNLKCNLCRPKYQAKVR
ncbi:MAG: substrate-binding domain-containing protein, partial [Desulfobacterium sp.]|nr:substrate-binding domain-containing protein [Desulfobacterium sp.]